ncbi:uncharacterized protein CDAR_514771 [Caerostris darwini]|uniref:Uncharacterized protein n=1 Tax=Caerostris darwini TaxID=1538125 RepID=A0AAV4QGN4_9ARAC|nr:uncharacterized protein CDAR_514771 [Caerostris darwini]
MGCGAAKSANARGDGSSDDVEPVSNSVTQIRDMAPAEVADTGAHPPRRDDPIRRNVCYQAATTLILPGVVPETPFEFDANRLSSNSRRGESLIKMHPPKKPQRLEDTDLKIKTIESDAKVTAVEQSHSIGQ